MAIGSVYRPFIQLARDAGVDIEAELARFGMHEQELSESRLPPAHGRALVLRLGELCGIRELGLEAARRVQLTDLDLVGYMARNADTALAALENGVRYPALLGDTALCQLVVSDGHVTIRFGLTGGQQLVPDGADYAAATLYRLVAELTGGEAKPLEVQLTRPRPARPRVYREFFGVLPLFGAPLLLVRFEEALLRRPLASRDARLHRILEERARATTDALALEADLLTRVRTRVRRSLDTLDVARGDIGHVAASCGMSERTLRRQLEAAGTSFRKLVDEVRRARALELIDEGRTRIGELAAATGYADLTAFGRAFRRWTGLAPLQYLERHRPGDLHRTH